MRFGPIDLWLWNIFQLHFGANSGSLRFALENQAVNEATFRCPDELGWKPQVPILLPLLFHIQACSFFISLYLCDFFTFNHSFSVYIPEGSYHVIGWKHLACKTGVF